MCVAMSNRGRPPAWSNEQRGQVLALADTGIPQREIAETVFGDARYRGRVERILRSRHSTRSAPPPSPAGGTLEAERDLLLSSELETAKELVARYERSLVESGEVPSLPDIERLHRVRRQLEAWEMVEQARALMRRRQ